jgi:hypothetical protein
MLQMLIAVAALSQIEDQDLLLRQEVDSGGEPSYDQRQALDQERQALNQERRALIQERRALIQERQALDQERHTFDQEQRRRAGKDSDPRSEQPAVTTYKPPLETEYREQRTVVRRAVQQPVWQDQTYTICEPVTMCDPRTGCPMTTMVSRVVTCRTQVCVTRYVDGVVTKRVPVQVRKMARDTKTIQGACTPIATSYRLALSGRVDDSGWRATRR